MINPADIFVMGIINATPDSFYDGDNKMDMQSIISRAEKLIEEGADILDIGGMSTRPGAEIISAEEEINRVLPIIEYLRENYPNVVLSIDTIYAKVAEKVLEKGVHIVNDVSGGTFDKEILDVVASYQAPYILMHSDGIPAKKVTTSGRDKTQFLNEILKFFIDRCDMCRKKGINDIIVDPGFGFGKTLDENYFILQNLSVFKLLEKTILVGISRKSMIYNLINSTSQGALNGTAVLNTIALSKGAQILRVHDAKEAVECRKLFKKLAETGK